MRLEVGLFTWTTLRLLSFFKKIKLKNINRQKGPSTKFQEFHMGSLNPLGSTICVLVTESVK